MSLDHPLGAERPPTLRWVLFIAIAIPFVVFVGGAALFIRIYIAPPMIAIPNPAVFAAAPPDPPAKTQADVPVRESPILEPATQAATEPATSPATVTATPPAAQAREPAPPLPMISSLVFAPPAPTVDVPATVPAEPERSTAMTTPAGTSETGESITGAIPLPRSKPRLSAAVVTGPVPLPRARPIEDSPAPTIVPLDRHTAD